MSKPVNEQSSEETQTLHADCSKAEQNFFAPLQTPFQGSHDGQNLISWRWSLPLPTNQVWWGSMHAISSYRGNRPTHTPTYSATHPATNRQDRLQYTVSQLAHSVMSSAQRDKRRFQSNNDLQQSARDGAAYWWNKFNLFWMNNSDNHTCHTWLIWQMQQTLQWPQMLITMCHIMLSLSLCFNGHFPGEPGLAGVNWSKGWWRWWWQLEL